MLLVNASFVGGFGACRKALALTKSLRQHKVPFRMCTDSLFVQKLGRFGVKPEVVIPWAPDNEGKYRNVERALAGVDYTAMISLGWRTFVPADAVQKGRPAVIIDGGWPERLEPYPGEFCEEVYKGLAAYCLTSHFPVPVAESWLPELPPGIRFQWVGQPFSLDEFIWHRQLRQWVFLRMEVRRLKAIQRFPELLRPYKRFVFLNMAPDYVQPWQFERVGGWMTSEQLDECRGFVTRLIAELNAMGGCLVFMLSDIADQFRGALKQCKNLRVVERRFVDPATHHVLRMLADVVICRAIRDVSSAQLALSGQKVLHMICPARGDYMGEWTSAMEAEEMGIAKMISHEEGSLGGAIEEWIASPESSRVADKAAKVAEAFLEEVGVPSILEVLGYWKPWEGRSCGRSDYSLAFLYGSGAIESVKRAEEQRYSTLKWLWR